MKAFMAVILSTLVSISGFCLSEGVKITLGEWQHWKSGGAHFTTELCSKGFSLTVLKQGKVKHDILVYSNNDLKIEKDKHYIFRFKVKSNRDSVTFNSRLGSETEELNYFYRAISVKKANIWELNDIRFTQKGDLIKFLKLYFEFGQLDPDVRIEMNDAEIVEE